MYSLLARIPSKGEKFHFFDDGKTSPSRHFIVTILDIYKISDLSPDIQEKILEDQEYCDWLFAKETDYVLKGRLNDPEIEDLYFIRTIDGGWFSVGYWGGELDIDGKKFKKIIDTEFKYFKHSAGYRTWENAKDAYNKQSDITEEMLEGVTEWVQI